MRTASTSLGQWKLVFQGNVFVLGFVSFLTDLSTEMIYPLLPAFFSGLLPPTAVAVYIGLMEGLSESTASLLKFFSGRVSDRLSRRKPLALAGYAISSTIRPFTAMATGGWHVVALRLGDRIGKGIRTAPRDALLSESAPSGIRGRAFSFHRLMDHAGAVAGPLVAAAFLNATLVNSALWHQGEQEVGPAEMASLRWLFVLAALPGLAATLCLWRWIQERPRSTGRQDEPRKESSDRSTDMRLRFIVFLIAVVLFTLGNSSDLFLIFYAQTHFGMGIGWLLNLWILLHLSKIVFSLPGGWLADRIGRKVAIFAGWSVYVAVYLWMPFMHDFSGVCILLILYGAYYGMAEGAERALVADFVGPRYRGKAFGWYHGAVGLSALPASFLFGLIWVQFGSKAAFFFGASLAGGALLLLPFCFSGKRNASLN